MKIINRIYKFIHFLSDFSSNRKKRVVLHGQNSCCNNVYAGLPQGSILVSLSFLICINDLSDNLSFNVLLMIIYFFSSSPCR